MPAREADQEVRLECVFLVGVPGPLNQVVDQHLGVNFLPDEEGRCLNDHI